MSPHCLHAAKKTRELGFETLEIYTNGLSLRGRLYRELRDLSPTFAFSFYSHVASRHDAITRTQGSHARTLDAIARCLADDLSVRVSVIAMDGNEGDLEQTRALLEGMGVVHVAVDVQRSVGRGRFVPREIDSPNGNAGHVSNADAHFDGRIAVSAGGEVFPCIFSRHLALGSVLGSSLTELLEAEIPLSIGASALGAGSEALLGKLACLQCRTRTALLSGQAGLLQIGTRA
jgi:MoaA/NifB/PqqE/SkfB family radical SAM enzyme